MSIKKTIEMARAHLQAGNAVSYAQLMSAAIRSAMSDRAVKAYRDAIAEDRTEKLFVGFDTSCPRAA